MNREDRIFLLWLIRTRYAVLLQPGQWCCSRAALNVRAFWMAALASVFHCPSKALGWEFPLWLSRLQTWWVSMRMWLWSLASLSGLRILSYYSCSSNSTPSLGTTICCRCGPKKQKKKKSFKLFHIHVFLPMLAELTNRSYPPLFKTQLTVCFLVLYLCLCGNNKTWYLLTAHYTSGTTTLWAKYYYLHITDENWGLN